MRQAGWYIKKIKELQITTKPESSSSAVALNSYFKVQGLTVNFVKLLINLNEYSFQMKFKNGFNTNTIFKKYSNFFLHSILPKNYNIIHWHRIFAVHSILMISYRSWCIAHQVPSRGQREWSNAHTVKNVTSFLRTSLMAYELDFFKALAGRKYKYFTKTTEIKLKSRYMPKVKKQKKWNKFKKRGQRRLARKLKKKTPWQ